MGRCCLKWFYGTGKKQEREGEHRTTGPMTEDREYCLRTLPVKLREPRGQQHDIQNESQLYVFVALQKPLTNTSTGRMSHSFS